MDGWVVLTLNYYQRNDTSRRDSSAGGSCQSRESASRGICVEQVGDQRDLEHINVSHN